MLTRQKNRELLRQLEETKMDNQEEGADVGIQAQVEPAATPVARHIQLPSGAVPYKLQPFAGLHSENAEEFLTDFREYAKLYSLSSDQTKNLFVLCLKDRAKRWFRSTFPDVEATSYEDVFKAFEQEFFKTNGIDWQKESTLDTIKQYHTDSVHAYGYKVEKLAAELKKPDLSQLQAFVRGLLPVYKKAVLAKGPKTFKEALEMAALAENAELVLASGESQSEPDDTRQLLKRLSLQISQMDRKDQTDITPSSERSAKQTQRVSESKRQLTCYFCNKVGHKQSECREKNRNTTKSKHNPQCMFCGKLGHFAAECRQLARMGLGTSQRPYQDFQ